MATRVAATVLNDESHMVESTPRAMDWAVDETAPPVAWPDFPKRRAARATDSTAASDTRAATASTGVPSASSPVEQRDAPEAQPAAEQLPRPGQPAPHRALGESELPGRLFLGHPLEVADHDGRPVRSRQPADLLVEDADQFVPVLPLV